MEGMIGHSSLNIRPVGKKSVSGFSNFRPHMPLRSRVFRQNQSSNWASASLKHDRPASGSVLVFNATVGAEWQCVRSRVFPVLPAIGGIQEEVSSKLLAAYLD